MRGCYQLDQIAIALCIERQQCQVRRRLFAGRGVALAKRLWRHIRLTANDGPDARLFRGLVKLHRAIEVAVIGDGHRRHTARGRFPYKIPGANRTIQ